MKFMIHGKWGAAYHFEICTKCKAVLLQEDVLEHSLWHTKLESSIKLGF